MNVDELRWKKAVGSALTSTCQARHHFRIKALNVRFCAGFRTPA
jgi:hypothetical protein